MSYRVQIRLKGYPTERATFARKIDAKLWAQQIESAIREGRHLVTNEAKKHTVGDLVERHLDALQRAAPHAYAKQRQLLYWWKERLGVRALTHLTPAVIAEQRDKLLAENISGTDEPRYRTASTANRYLAALSKACTIAVREWHWMQANPLLQVQKGGENAGRVRYLTDPEKDALIKACGESELGVLKLIVLLALTTGMRRGEILALRWPDIDMKRGSIVIHKTKNKERRAVPIVPQVMPLLAEHAQVRRLDTDLVFPRPGEDRRPLDIRNAFEDAVRAAKIDDFRFHDTRHSCASWLAMSGATAPEIAAVLGHRTLQMVKRYAHLGDVHTSAVVERMTKKFFG